MDMMPPPEPGTYALVLQCRGARRIRVGRLGTLALFPGWYVYVGSAHGPGGLRARITHHRGRTARPHWHIDYLRRATRFDSVWWECGNRGEHEWASRAGAAAGACIPLPRFGSSDCRCPAHLFHFAGRPDLGAILGDKARC
jgi:Uri superfamily endonuclease